MNTYDKCISILKNDMPTIYEQYKNTINGFCKTLNPICILDDNNTDINIGLFYNILANECVYDSDYGIRQEYCDLGIHLHTLSIQNKITYGYIDIAIIYSHKKDYTNALKYYNIALKEHQNGTFESLHIPYDKDKVIILEGNYTYSLIAYDYEAQNDMPNAIKYFELSIIHDKYNECGLLPIYHLGEIYFNFEKYNDAARCFKSSIERQEINPVCIASITNLYIKQKKYSELAYAYVQFAHLFDCNKEIVNLLSVINNEHLIDAQTLIAEIEMIILEHLVQFRTSDFGYNIGIESHHAFRKKQCFLKNELIDSATMPNCIADLIVEY